MYYLKDKMNKNKQNKKSKRGFSMLEMLIAGFILSVGLIATLKLVANSMSNSTDARDHVIASGLAQEGLELVRNIRDNSTSMLTIPRGSFYKLPVTNDSVTELGDCRVSKEFTEIDKTTDCGSGINDKKLYIDGNNFYVHGAGAATKFQRKIRLQYQNSAGGAMDRENSTEDIFDDDAYQVNIRVAVTWATNFPTDPYNIATATTADDCNLQNKCVMLESTLTKRN